jgi:hypothetical protein
MRPHSVQYRCMVSLPDPALKVPWRPGPAAGTADRVLISFTEFTFNRFRDLPGILWAGMRLRRGWDGLHGAVGLALYLRPLSRRGGSLSAWESEADLRGFVSLPYHVHIMRKYRTRGSLRSARWRTERFALSSAWRDAERRLGEPPV